MRHLAFGTFLIGGWLALLPAQAQPQQPAPQAPQLPAVREAGDGIVRSLGLDAAGLTVVRADAELHRSLHGDLKADTVLPIASASKWLTVATILTLVDDGLLDIDQPVARYVEEFDRDDKRRVTLRQCMSCTSGLPARVGGRMRGWDMERFAEKAADTALRSQPDAAFLYGGVGFQVAAVAAERVTGKSWHELFRDRIARPLGMQKTLFGALQPIGSAPGSTELPWAGGGAVSTLADYTRFVQMLLGDGEFDGKRVLSKKSVEVMMRDHVPQRVEVRAASYPQADVRYGLGTWIQQVDEQVVRYMDPGAFGWTPWIDPDLGVGGVFAVQDRVARVLRNLEDVLAVVREAVQAPAVAGTAEAIKLRHDGRDRRYHLHVPPHEQNVAGMPLLLMLHGGGGNGAQARDTTRLDELGVQHGFVVAFPDGTGMLPKRLLTWNSGGIDVYAARNDVDDVGFLKAVVHDIKTRVPINPDRVFVAGHSNGGMMCHRLAREAADVFAGIAVVAGAMNFTDADSPIPLAVLLVHGTGDEHVLIGGGEPKVSRVRTKRSDASLQDAIDYYLRRNALSGYAESAVDGDVRVDDYAKASGDTAVMPLRVVTLEGGGHAWPGSGERARVRGDRPFDWDASRAIVEWFASLQPMPRPRSTQTPSVPR